MNIDGMGRPRSQPPRLMSERDRYTLARAYYGELCAQQNLPAEQREWFDVEIAIRIVLALFPELVVDHSITKPTLEFDFEEDGKTMQPAPADDNIIYLR